MQTELVFIVKDEADNSVKYISDDEHDAYAVRDWFEANTKPMFGRGKRTSWIVEESEVYTSPLDTTTHTFAVHVTVWDKNRWTYSITPRAESCLPTKVRQRTETWMGKSSMHLSLFVYARNLSDALRKANTELEPYGVVLT